MWISAALLVALVAGGMLGHRIAREDAASSAALARSQADRELRLQQEQSELLQQKVDEIERAHAVAVARSESLQSTLDDTMKQMLQDADELALYRSIASGENQRERGVAVDKVALAGDTLEITLMQYRGRERVSGTLGISFTGEQEGVYKRWVMTDSRTGELTAYELPRKPIASDDVSQWDEELWSESLVTIAPFELRFFQTIVVNAESITTFEPDNVEVLIQPDSKDLRRSIKRLPWSSVLP